MLLLQVKDETGSWSTLDRSRDRAELRVFLDDWRSNVHQLATAVMRIVDEREERRRAAEEEYEKQHRWRLRIEAEIEEQVRLRKASQERRPGRGRCRRASPDSSNAPAGRRRRHNCPCYGCSWCAAIDVGGLRGFRHSILRRVPFHFSLGRRWVPQPI
jgi:hypothetical protein